MATPEALQRTLSWQKLPAEKVASSAKEGKQKNKEKKE